MTELRIPALRTFARPQDQNPSGDIFGGWLLSQMDMAGGSVAAQRARGRVVTIGIEAMKFHSPVFVGDEVSCYADIVKVGNTSITVHIDTVVRRPFAGEIVEQTVTEGVFTYVALGPDRKKRRVDQ
jgi:acyl-CoA thioesterase YciA